MAARYQIGFLMDPYPSLNLDTETSLLLMDELIRRGHAVYWLEQTDITLGNRGVTARLPSVRSTAPFELDDAASIDINALNALVIRKDPPFDRTYLHVTQILDHLDERLVQINSPAALRNLNEKLTTLRWPEFCPQTLVSCDPAQLLTFATQFQRVVIKPLGECSGRGIAIMRHSDPDFVPRIAAMQAAHGFLMAQEYLDNVAFGDKRVFVVAGEPIGWVNRLPADAMSLANIHQGATCAATSLSALEQRISLAVGRTLLHEGILLAGLDFIDGRLTEINVTSPSAVRQINAVTGGRLELTIVDAILSHIAAASSRDPAGHKRTA
ncbi:MAG: hypothetical protein R3E86_00715 [Pseudomonadales bacterium]